VIFLYLFDLKSQKKININEDQFLLMVSFRLSSYFIEIDLFSLLGSFNYEEPYFDIENIGGLYVGNIIFLLLKGFRFVWDNVEDLLFSEDALRFL
jgi:hypothetical protein